VEFVGGPWDGRPGRMNGLPGEITGPGGRYVRSVRCADDGAMRYVRESSEAASAEEGSEGVATWPIGS